jgi:capsular exopolysaccharide synthesis family protein
MGKTHEALIRAEKEYQNKTNKTSVVQQRALVPSRLYKDLPTSENWWYKELKSKLQMQYPEESLKTILFTGTSRRAGASMSARGYANCLADDYRHKVLLIEFNLHSASKRSGGVVHQPDEFSNIFFGYSGLNDHWNQNRSSNLFAISCSREALQSAGLTRSNQLDEFLRAMRESFDYVILDAPPITLFSETRIICNMVDGIILVLEFGKTRKQVANKVKQELEAAGGNFLGVVINKRKYYIPKWIYKRL